MTDKAIIGYFILLPILYILFGAITIAMYFREPEVHEVVLWPITWFKFLVKCLFKSLFTGWDFK